MRYTSLTFDAAPSARSVDENGFLHVASSHITKATVNPYYGREIPGCERLGLDPERIYYGFRDPEELRRSLPTWEGLPLHIEHHPDSADAPEKLTRVGAVGKAVWNAPYVDAPLTVWDGEAIDAIEDGSFRELSCAYRYEPDFTPGQYEGVEYDFIMRNIRGNHVALVEEGRAGPDVVVADAALDAREGEGWITTKNGKRVHFKDGEIDKGNIGQENGGKRGGSSGKEISLTGKELGDYKDVKELRQKVVAWYKEHLQGKPAHRDDVGEIRFSKKGRDEMKTFSADQDKLLMVPALRNIIETGTLGQEEPLNHPREDGIVAFVPVTKKIKFKGESREVEVLLGKDQRGNLYYDLFLDGARQEGKKKSPASYPEPKSGVAGDSMTDMPSAVALNIAIDSIRVNPQTGADHLPKPNLIKGAVMRMKNWFRGARDASPDIERQEVDLAQAIIDLHKVDPNTGEIVDITEDEDKAAEIRKLIGELSGKLEPEEVKKLTDAMTDLAYSRATGDADPDDRGAAIERILAAVLDLTPEQREKLRNSTLVICGFNPRLRAGGDYVCYTRRRGKVQFQSTPPRGRRPMLCSQSRGHRLVSIHASAREATAAGEPLDA